MIGSYFKGYSSKATTYYRSYSRALLKYVNNGFFARDLDADDFAFIERVRERGCVPCGSLAWPVATACTHSDDIIPRVALIEEMDFWQQPYQVDTVVVRRSGPVVQPPRPVGMTPGAIKRKADRELKLAAIAEEQRRAQEKQREQLRRDIEWERAAPKSAPFGDVNGRHFVPQWKVNDKVWTTRKLRKLPAAEQAELGDLTFNGNGMRIDQRRVAARKLAREAADRDGQRLTVQEADDAADRILGIEPECDRQERLRREYWARDKIEREAAETKQRQEHERLKATNAVEARAEAKWQQRFPTQEEVFRRENVKRLILATMQMTFPRMVTLEQLMISTRCDDKEFVMQCAEELCNEGHLNHKTEPAT